MPFHHKVNEGVTKCTDCHDPHGTFSKSNLKSTADQNAVCTKCHMETRGPFVFEHAAVRAEGCVDCHSPHGSQNPRLLNMRIATLCNQCHSPVALAGFMGWIAGSATCDALHQLPHDDSRFERQSGICPVMEDRTPPQAGRRELDGSRFHVWTERLGLSSEASQ